MISHSARIFVCDKHNRLHQTSIKAKKEGNEKNKYSNDTKRYLDKIQVGLKLE